MKQFLVFKCRYLIGGYAYVNPREVKYYHAAEDNRTLLVISESLRFIVDEPVAEVFEKLVLPGDPFRAEDLRPEAVRAAA